MTTVKIITTRGVQDWAAFVTTTDDTDTETRVRFHRKWVSTCDEHGTNVHCEHVTAALDARSTR